MAGCSYQYGSISCGIIISILVLSKQHEVFEFDELWFLFLPFCLGFQMPTGTYIALLLKSVLFLKKPGWLVVLHGQFQ